MNILRHPLFSGADEVACRVGRNPVKFAVICSTLFYCANGSNFYSFKFEENNFRIVKKIVCHHVAENKIVFSPEKFIHPINFQLQFVTML